MSERTGIKAVVQAIVPGNSSHGPYVTANNRKLKGSVTFSLRASVWQEKSKPKPGDSVFLDDVRENRSGWRAHVARFWKPSDEQE